MLFHFLFLISAAFAQTSQPTWAPTFAPTQPGDCPLDSCIRDTTFTITPLDTDTNLYEILDYSDTYNESCISHILFPVPVCGDIDNIVAVDCEGFPLEVAVNETSANCNLNDDFPSLVGYEFIKVNVNASSICPEYIEVTIPGAVAGGGMDRVCFEGFKAGTECCEYNVEGMGFGCPLSPTQAPSPAPTQLPSAAPTQLPSAAPTNQPTTDAPTASPTSEPTIAPGEPTPAPTQLPSAAPTLQPTTDAPTSSPTNQPTTDAPTSSPTLQPTTNEPTASPTLQPTTDEPTAAPTNQPTDAPSPAPPTPQPTDGPTSSPTLQPSAAPTLQPTTDSPTTSPTFSPTFSPTPEACSDDCPAIVGYTQVNGYCGLTGLGTCLGVDGVCSYTNESTKGYCSGDSDVSCCFNSDCTCGCLLTDDISGNTTAHQCGLNCTAHEDCVDPQPQNLCYQQDCWDGICMEVEAVLCEEHPPDLCTIDYCVPIFDGENYTTDCIHEQIPDCCTSVDDCDHITPGTCQHVICDIEQGNLTGTCALVPNEGNCCVSDDDCVSPINDCQLSTCTIDNECDGIYYEKDCSWLDTDSDRCTIGICNETAGGECVIDVISDELCPGACCFPNATCYDDDSWCVDKCEQLNNGTFQGISTWCNETSCEPTQAPSPAPTQLPSAAPTLLPTTSPTLVPTSDSPTQAPSLAPTLHPTSSPTTDAPTASPTNEPTASPTTSEPSPAPSNGPTTAPTTSEPTASPTNEPTLAPTTNSPTLAPTLNPTTDAPTLAPTTDSPTLAPSVSPTVLPTPAPTHECEVDEECPDDISNKCRLGACVENVCDFAEQECDPAPDNCTTVACDPYNGMCTLSFDQSCCQLDLLDHCYESGLPCIETFCNITNITTGTGFCDERELDNCCESNEECQNGNICSAAVCDIMSRQCENVNETLACPDVDDDDCSGAICIPFEGCAEVLEAGHMKCPGACCHNASSCSYIDYFECLDVGGTWKDSDTSCADEDVCATPSPTASPTSFPTALPTPKPTTTSPPTVPPTPQPTSTPTLPPTTPMPTIEPCPDELCDRHQCLSDSDCTSPRTCHPHYQRCIFDGGCDGPGSYGCVEERPEGCYSGRCGGEGGSECFPLGNPFNCDCICPEPTPRPTVAPTLSPTPAPTVPECPELFCREQTGHECTYTNFQCLDRDPCLASFVNNPNISTTIHTECFFNPFGHDVCRILGDEGSLNALLSYACQAECTIKTPLINFDGQYKIKPVVCGDTEWQVIPNDCLCPPTGACCDVPGHQQQDQINFDPCFDKWHPLDNYNMYASACDTLGGTFYEGDTCVGQEVQTTGNCAVCHEVVPEEDVPVRCSCDGACCCKDVGVCIDDYTGFITERNRTAQSVCHDSLLCSELEGGEVVPLQTDQFSAGLTCGDPDIVCQDCQVCDVASSSLISPCGTVTCDGGMCAGLSVGIACVDNSDCDCFCVIRGFTDLLRNCDAGFGPAPAQLLEEDLQCYTDTYAYYMCRVLNNCGDKYDQVCNSNVISVNCLDMNCCELENVPLLAP